MEVTYTLEIKHNCSAVLQDDDTYTQFWELFIQE